MVTDSFPSSSPPPMAALRTLRRASHYEATFADVELSAKHLANPFADLSAAWNGLQASLAAYRRDRTAESWQALHDALVGLDGAVAVFLGPSGWEPCRR